MFIFNAEQSDLKFRVVSLSASGEPVLQEFFDRYPECLHICNERAAQNSEVLQLMRNQGTKWIRSGVVKEMAKQKSSVRDELRKAP